MGSLSVRVALGGAILSMAGVWAFGPAPVGLAWAAAALTAGIWRHGRDAPTGQVAWLRLLFTAGGALWVISDTWRVVGARPLPVLPQLGPEALAIVATVVMTVVIFWVTYLRGRPRVETWLDGGIFLAALAPPVWILLLQPAAGDPDAMAGAVLSVAVLAAVMLAGSLFVMSGGIWSVPAVLLALAVTSTVVTGATPRVLGTPDQALPLFVPGYVLAVFVSLHPALPSVFVRGGRPSGIPLSTRVWMLVLAVSLPLLTLAWFYVRGERAPIALIGGSVLVIAGVVSLRAWLMVRAGVPDWSVPLTISASAILVATVAIALTLLSQSARTAEQRAAAVSAAIPVVGELDGQLLRTLQSRTPGSDAAARRWRALSRRLARAGVVPAALLARYEREGRGAIRAAASGQDIRVRDVVDGPISVAHRAIAREAAAELRGARTTARRRAASVRLFTAAILAATLLAVGLLLLRFNAAHRRLEVQHLKTHDELTGLRNRAALDRALDHAAPATGESARSLVLLDLDDFKAINDSFGRRIGDAVLRTVAWRLDASMRGEQTLSRVGGNAFAVLVPSGDDPLGVAHRALAALAEPIEVEGHPHAIACSIGIASVDEDDDERHASTMRNAELAMYHAKRITGDSIEIFVADMHQRARDRLQLAADLRAALESDELHLAYQPIVATRTGEIAGYEALVRWDHPTRGPMSPAEFIPIAEQSNLIVELGAWVLRTAAAQMAAWQAVWDDDRYVSVNVAASQLTTRALLPQVRAALDASQLRPDRLVLEVTESSLIDDIEASVEQMRQVRAAGVRFALDDFGTGYSSLSYLQRFPVDLLKIDKAFIDAIGDPDGLALVRAIVNMAASLQLRVVAEGVETVDQAEALQHFGCHLLQGYRFCRPVSAGDVTGLPPTYAMPEAPAMRAVT